MSSNSQKSSEHILIIGGGIIGISSGLSLLERGFKVTLIEPEEPGHGASFGNAGCLAVSEVVPISVPGMLRHVPGWLLDPLGPLSIRWQHFPKLLPWLWRFNQAGNAKQVEHASRAQADLMRVTTNSWKSFAGKYGLTDKITWNGKLVVYETDKGFESDKGYWDWSAARGVKQEFLSSDDVQDLEPGLAARFRKGVLTPAYAHVSDPFEILQSLLTQFQQRGGKILQARVRRFLKNADGVHAVRLEDDTDLSFDQVLISAGVWSKKLVEDLGYKVLLESERGYNTSLPHADVELNRPIMFGEGHFVISPLKSGLRIGGAAEFAGMDAPPNYTRAKNLLKIARRYLPDLDLTEKREWMGPRPSTPDTIAVVGRAPRHDNVLMAFGHGHLGLTQAAGTADLIAQLAAKEKTEIDLSAFSIDRFN